MARGRARFGRDVPVLCSVVHKSEICARRRALVASNAEARSIGCSQMSGTFAFPALKGMKVAVGNTSAARSKNFGARWTCFAHVYTITKLVANF